MQLFTIWLVFVVHFCCAFAAQNSLQPAEKTEVISLKNGGQVRGFVQSVDIIRDDNKPDQIKVSTFIGIQYATAKRFEKPVKLPENHWKGVQEVTKYKFACPQENLSLGTEKELSSQSTNANQTKFASEDCLYLNIWSPQKEGNETSKSPPLAVMVWIHDGTETALDNLISRSTIFSKAFDGQRLAATGNVVVVTIAYRVGVFGYLHFADDGKDLQNFGLYDQIEALKWVQENIRLFRGDPSRVTIFGDAGGAVSVGILVLSPKADGLFQRAILQSGSPIAVVDDYQSAAAKTHLLGSMVGCKGSKKKLLNCLQTKPTLELLNTSLAMAGVGLYFRPVFGEESLLPKSPLDLLLQKKNIKNNNRKVDLLFGITENEGAPTIYDLYPQLDVNESLSVEEAEQLISNLMHLLQVPYLEEVLDFYLDDLSTSSHQPNETELRKAVENLYGDLTTVVPTILYAQLLYKKQQLDKSNNKSGRFYAYHLGQPLPVTSSSGCLPWMGVCSGSTVEYIFGINTGNKSETNVYQKLSRSMMAAWATFAESGEPKLPKDLSTSKSATTEMKWKEAFSSSEVSDKRTIINFMTLKVGELQNVKEDLLLNNEQNCSEIAFWADKLITMYSTGNSEDDD